MRVPVGQKVEPERAPPNKILSIIPLKNVAVCYSDGAGTVHREVWMVSQEGTIYKHPDTEQWAQRLRTVKDTMAEQVKAELARQAAPDAGIPEQDGVDVVSEQVASEEKPSVDV